MTANLGFEEFAKLLQTVFKPGQGEQAITVLTDLPSAVSPDSPQWSDRRKICAEWYALLRTNIHSLPFREVLFCCYNNVGSNNNDLPAQVYRMENGDTQVSSVARESVPLDDVLKRSSVVIAATEFSATAPLKLLARKYGFRGATLPGFTRSMIPSLSLDYEKIHARVMDIKERMDMADTIRAIFEVAGQSTCVEFDVRYRTGHASGGLIRERGTVGNLPSGEAYIVPYEGEQERVPSQTSGLLPVQFDDEIVFYQIENNRASIMKPSGKHARRELAKLLEEPAYGNIAEVGIGVLGEWGLKACGSVLLDEKLGLHIAFGRSDHFGGIVGPSNFRRRENVIHIDRVYVPSLQPMITVREVTFRYSGGRQEMVMADGTLVV
jgi:hypothetical protein